MNLSLNRNTTLTAPHSIPKYVYGILVALVFFLYGNTLKNGYNLDDNLVTQNHRLTSKGLAAIPQIFTSFYYEDASGYAYEYRPIVLSSFAIEHTLWGDNPTAGHFVNVILYALSICILLHLLALVFHQYNLWLPFLAVLIFTAHPMHTEVVASLKNRDEIFAFLFSVLAWRAAWQWSMKEQWKSLALFAGFFLLALMSKLSIVGFSVLIPLSLFFFSKIKLKHTFILSAIAAIGVVVFSPINHNLHRLYLFLLIAFTPAFVQIIGTPEIRNSYFNFLKKIMLPEKLLPPENEAEILPQYAINPWLLGFAVLFIIALASLGIAFNYFIGALLSVMASFFLLLVSEKKYKKWWALLFGIVGLSAAYFFQIKILAHYILWMYIFLIWSYPSQKKFFLTLFLLAIFPAYYSVENTLFIAIIALSISLFLKNKKALALYSLGFFIALIYNFFAHKNQLDPHAFFEYFITFLLPASLWNFLSKKQGSIVLIVAISGISLLSLFQFREYLTTPIALKNQFEAVAQIAQNTTSNSTYRPLNFIEYPLGFDATLSEKVGTAATIFASYLKMSFLPYPFRFYFGYAEIEVQPWHDLTALVAIIIIGFLLLSVFVFYKKHKPIAFGILLYLVSIFIFSNMLYAVAGMMSERFLFHALLGFSLALSYLILKVLRIDVLDTSRFILSPNLKFVLPLILLPYSYLTIVRNTDWKDPVTLMENDITHLSKSAHAHYLLGYHLMQRSIEIKNVQEVIDLRKQSIKYYRNSLKIYPNNVNACIDLGNVYLSINDLDNAYLCLKKACALDSTLEGTKLTVAQIAEEQKNFAEAIKIYEEVIKTNPNKMEVYGSLSQLFFRLEAYEKSIAVNLSAIQHKPEWKAPYENLARTYYALGDTALSNYYINQMPQ